MPETVLAAVAGGSADAIHGRFELKIGDERIPVVLIVPAGAVSVEDLLPIFRGLADLFAARASARARAAGRSTSCAAGCGACCRQAVPLSASEARDIARLVESLPEPRKSAVQQRFADAQQRLAAARFDGRIERTDRDYSPRFANAYFRLGIACPFLEDESCSIHEVRPVICREYLVKSPPAYCAAPDLRERDIAVLMLEASLCRALSAYEADEGLVLLPFATAIEIDAPAPRPAQEILTGVLACL